MTTKPKPNQPTETTRSDSGKRNYSLAMNARDSLKIDMDSEDSLRLLLRPMKPEKK